jgi:hypothetical protein
MILKLFPSRVIRSWVKKTGPGDDILMRRGMIMKRRGEKIIIPARAPKRSMVLFTNLSKTV